MSDKELDEIFKKKLTSREFDFNHANWEAMEAILDADKKPAVFYWWSSAAIVAFGLVTSALLLLQNPTAVDLPSALPNSPQENVYDNAAKVNDLVNTEINDTDQNRDASNIVGQNNDDHDSADPIDSQQEETNSIVNNDLQSTTNFNGQSQDGGAASNLNQDSQLNTPSSNGGSTNIVAATTADGQNADAASQINTESQDLLNSDLLSLDRKGFSLFTKVAEVDLITNRVRPNFIRKFQKQHELSLVGGLGISPAFNDNGSSGDWLIGLNYEYRFSFVWSLNVGLNYNARTSPGIKHSSDSTFISFGRELVITEVENTRLDYVEIPIQITHTLSPRHQVGLGVYTSALFNIVTQTDRTSITTHETVTTTSKSMGLSDNFRNFDYGLTGSYNYQYNPSLSLGLQMKYGLSDITVNHTPELSGYHRNVSTRLILRYRLF